MKDLIEELKQAGAKPEEAEELASFAEVLKFKVKERSIAEKLFAYASILKRLQVPESKTFSFSRFFASFILAFLFFFGTFAYAAANSLPGEGLYGVKIAGESLIGQISPKFRETSALRRSEEIKTLIKKQNSAKKIEIGLKEYKKQIESLPQENPIREQSRKNLEEARDSSTGKSRAEIEKTIEEGTVEGTSNKGEHKQAPTERDDQNKNKNENSH